ncbi:bifunctional nicotinamidase/pyrazinamidase [Vibrio spartinae]|uniref:Nicotinamidase n=1 Tax=Vibrio spartinae TaxID=1918945 RepID=A0A1N6M340_9VIBR|nr:bifunctional nicotinamidase/pyrazinamidase [Vibrio spartinae]QMV14375.1 nicotinamidase/pyrazinamidase [Vibrio spartinae]SIO93854.1 nicotinamidase/pyrazinamidase [Vibrio spartinae]
MTQTLVIVDVQNDFSPSGALPVPDGDCVVTVINRLMSCFEHVVATQDWHPAGHGSFASVHHMSPGEMIELNGIQQLLWPDHCIQSSWGSEFIPGLAQNNIEYIVYKGSNPEIDSYSGFFDNGKQQSTGLLDYLKKINSDELYIVGLATDYCVLFTALDAVELGFQTYVVQDACRAVNLAPDDEEKALAKMAQAGCQIIQSRDVLNE